VPNRPDPSARRFTSRTLLRCKDCRYIAIKYSRTNLLCGHHHARSEGQPDQRGCAEQHGKCLDHEYLPALISSWRYDFRNYTVNANPFARE
jgi:hypothetical protein